MLTALELVIERYFVSIASIHNSDSKAHTNILMFAPTKIGQHNFQWLKMAICVNRLYLFCSLTCSWLLSLIGMKDYCIAGKGNAKISC